MISSDFCEEVTCKASNYNKSFLSSCSFISIGTYYALGAESSMEICSLYSFTPLLLALCVHTGQLLGQPQDGLPGNSRGGDWGRHWRGLHFAKCQLLEENIWGVRLCCTVDEKKM